ncbi:MAG TPA: HEAT repeat domain-containing protein [Coriobacteriia bacterium]
MAGGKPTVVPRRILLFTTRLSTTMKSLRIYPSGSDIPRRNAQEVLETLKESLETADYLELGVTRNGLVFEGSTVFPRSQGFQSFARDFYKRNLAAFRFHKGVTPDEILRFLSLIIMPPEALAAQGGMEPSLSELGVVNISVTEAATRIVETVLPGGLDAFYEVDPEIHLEIPSDKSVEELLEEGGADQGRDKRVLMRVLRDRRAVAKYLQDARERDPEEGLGELAKRILKLARNTRDELPADQAAAIDVIAEAIMELHPDERGDLYESHLLEQARLDETIAAIIERLGVEEVVNCILNQINETPEALTGLSRAVRNLTLMNVSADQDTVLELAVAKLQGKGFSEVFIEDLGEQVAPSKIAGADQRSRRSGPIETVLRLVDMAPDSSDVFVYDDAVEPLRLEAARGTTDGDVISALVAVATLEERDAEFSAIMSMLEDSVGVLVDAHEADVAADVAEALSAVAAGPNVNADHRERMLRVVHSIASPESLARVTTALRRYRSDSAEYLACRRLLSVLGESMIDPLLEVLAREQDMSARKALIELISSSAHDYIPELGARMSDPRWYLVRNVVAILSSTHSTEALPYLQRTLRHADARVRRETIRGLAGIRVPLADSMVAAGLNDVDAQNVQFAVRHLGQIGAQSAVPALEQVALGTSLGNHDVAVRVEAIGALAKIGSPSSVTVMQELARKQGLFGGGRDREVRAAATDALQALSSLATGIEVNS